METHSLTLNIQGNQGHISSSLTSCLTIKPSVKQRGTTCQVLLLATANFNLPAIQWNRNSSPKLTIKSEFKSTSANKHRHWTKWIANQAAVWVSYLWRKGRSGEQRGAHWRGAVPRTLGPAGPAASTVCPTTLSLCLLTEEGKKSPGAVGKQRDEHQTMSLNFHLTNQLQVYQRPVLPPQ